MDTLHNYNPTHNYRPAAVVLAQDLAGAAWEYYNNLVDQICNAAQIAREDRVAMDVALQDARNAESNYRREYDAWQSVGGQSV